MGSLRQELITDRVYFLSQSLSIPPDQAFERLAHSLCVDISVYDFDDSDLVDGTQDKQIDLISIQEDADEATIYLISAKSQVSFSSNHLIQTKNGLDWIFRKDRQELETITNIPFKEKILAVKSAMNTAGFSNTNIKVFFVTKGETSSISNEFTQEAEGIKRVYDNQTFKSFSFEALGADELVNLIQRQEKKERSIDAEIAIKYDANAPSLIRYTSQGRRGIICTANATEIARLVDEDKTGALFESNVRRFLGQSGSVNSEITATATDRNESSLFWFLNNGITILCDKMDALTDPDDPKVRIKNLQIVNGCQTASSLAHAAKTGMLQPDTQVLLKIFEASSENFASKIVLTTNNQNRITSRDLKANDPIQIDIKLALERYGYFYEHKLNQYIDAGVTVSNKVVSNERLAQAYLAVILKKPSDASRRKYKIWSEYYSQIFKVRSLANHVLAYEFTRAAYSWAKVIKKSDFCTGLKHRLLSTGALHIASIAYQFWRIESPNQDVEVSIGVIHDQPELLAMYLDKALLLLMSVIEANPIFSDDLDLTLKSQTLDEALVARFKVNEPIQLPLGFPT